MADRNLIDDIKLSGGSNAATEVLYHHFREGAFRFIISKGTTEQDAIMDLYTDAILIFREDILREKYIYTSQAKPSTYLFQIIHNLLRTQKRKVDRYKRIENATPEEKIRAIDLQLWEDAGLDEYKGISIKLLNAKIRELLAGLVEKTQCVLCQYFINQIQKMPEIARICNLRDEREATDRKYEGIQTLRRQLMNWIKNRGFN